MIYILWMMAGPIAIVIFPVVVFILTYGYYTASIKTRLLFTLYSTFIKVALWWLLFLGLMFIRSNYYSPYVAVWESMSPAVQQGDLLILDNKSKNISRWDTVVYIPNWKNIPFIKRVIWLPWEEVRIDWWVIKICKKNKCEKLSEDYLAEWVTTSTAVCGISEFNLTDWYFMMWDNRSGSTDSRCCHGSSCEWDLLGKSEIKKDEISWKVIYNFKKENNGKVVDLINKLFLQ